MDNNQIVDIEQTCRNFIEAFEGTLSWQWDSRFETILAQFEIADKEKIEIVLNQFMNISWNNENISEAPESIQNLISFLGGLTPGQFLLTTDPEKDALLSCAWWPWGNGQTISIRVAPTINEVSTIEKEELLDVLKKLVT